MERPHFGNGFSVRFERPKLRNILLASAMAFTTAGTAVSWVMKEYSAQVLVNDPAYQKFDRSAAIYQDIIGMREALETKNTALADKYRTRLLPRVQGTGLEKEIATAQPGSLSFKLLEKSAYNTTQAFAKEIPEHLSVQYNCWKGTYALMMIGQFGLAGAWFYRKRD